MLPPSKASWLARNRPTSICSKETPSGLVSPAILCSVSPRLTSRWFCPSTGCSAGFCDVPRLRILASALPRSSSSIGVAACVPEGCLLASAGLAIAGAGGGKPLAATSGGSSRKVYSRTSRPAGQFSSRSMSTKGSLIGLSEVSRMTGWPLARLSRLKRMLSKVVA